MNQTKQFDYLYIKRASIQFIDDDGTAIPGVPFGCLGVVSQTPTVSEVTKTCEGAQVDSVTRKDFLEVSVEAFPNIDVYYQIEGIHNEGLKAGVFAYGNNVEGKRFIFTAEAEDMRGNVMLIAYPNAKDSAGFTFSIDNSATEVPRVTMTFRARQDDYGEMLYIAIKDEVTDEDIISNWHTAFNRALVELDAPTP